MSQRSAGLEDTAVSAECNSMTGQMLKARVKLATAFARSPLVRA